MDWSVVLTLFPYIMGLTGLVVFLVLFVLLYYKPRVELPLQNERLVGLVTMWLPGGFGLLKGAMTTARMTVEKYWTSLIENEKEDSKRKLWEDNKTFTLENYVFAIKDQGGAKKILIFDKNPEDQRFLDFDKEGGGLLLHGVQDCLSVGEYSGFENLFIKLNDELRRFNDEEKKRAETAAQSVKYLRSAATNVEKIAGMKESNEDLLRELEQERREKAQMRSKLSRALSALSAKPLSETGETKLKPGIAERLRKWGFTWWQLGTAGVLYFASGHIVKLLNIQPPLEEPLLTYVALGFALLGFFIIPIFKKLLGRWL